MGVCIINSALCRHSTSILLLLEIYLHPIRSPIRITRQLFAFHTPIESDRFHVLSRTNWSFSMDEFVFVGACSNLVYVFTVTIRMFHSTIYSSQCSLYFYYFYMFMIQWFGRMLLKDIRFDLESTISITFCLLLMLTPAHGPTTGKKTPHLASLLLSSVVGRHSL